MTDSSGQQDDLNAELLAAIEADLHDSLDTISGILPPTVLEMISYHLGWQVSLETSGKRIRPLMTLLCCQAAGGDWKTALPAASAIEWTHNFSLIHDDIQDRSELRRGRPTVWKKWGRAQAINTGDAIFVLSRLTTQRLAAAPQKILTVQKVLDETSMALTAGQHLDISFEDAKDVTIEDYLQMISGKTAALLSASCRIGALLATDLDGRIEAYASFGANLGMAFQIIDDLLGVWGASSATGKSSADDLQTRKKTLPVIYGLEHSPEFKRVWLTERQGDEDIFGMKQLLKEAGSNDFTKKWAEYYTQASLSSLETADPLEPAGTILTELAARLLQRIA
jgi:geranylgeranyl diphosphate synthase type I